jgi:hypothetical protein
MSHSGTATVELPQFHCDSGTENDLRSGGTFSEQDDAILGGFVGDEALKYLLREHLLMFD